MKIIIIIIEHPAEAYVHVDVVGRFLSIMFNLDSFVHIWFRLQKEKIPFINYYRSNHLKARVTVSDF